MKNNTKYFFFTCILIFTFQSLSALNDGSIKLIKFKRSIHQWNLNHPERNYSRFDRTEIEAIADNLIAWQNYDGGWPRNIDWLAKLNVDSVKRTLKKEDRRSSLDNTNVFPQIEYLNEVFSLTKKEDYKEVAEKGLRYILFVQQMHSGGWRDCDVDAISFNDEIMTGIMSLFLVIKEKKDFLWIDEDLYTAICKSYDKALDVTLRCQIKIDGKKTAWSQHHSHKTLKPIQARSFELPSIAAKESCDILLFLMSIEKPDDKIITAVNAGMDWLNKSEIKGLRLERVPLPKNTFIHQQYPYDIVVVEDPNAKPLWARFYDYKTNEAFLCNRTGEKVDSLSEVDPELRTDYGCYGYWPEKVYKINAVWKKRQDVRGR